MRHTALCVLIIPTSALLYFFFFNDTATTEIYTLSLHDALPISLDAVTKDIGGFDHNAHALRLVTKLEHRARTEEHTSELQSRSDLVCRLLLEKKKKIIYLHVEMRHVRTQL